MASKNWPQHVLVREPATRWGLGNGTHVVVQVAPSGISSESSGFVYGGPCCVSQNDTVCQHLMPCSNGISVVGDGHDEAWDVVVAKCIDERAAAVDACATTIQVPKERRRGEFSTAVCVPFFYGEMFNPRTFFFFASWVAHYRSLGANRVYIYSKGAAPGWVARALAMLGTAEALELVWVHLDFDFGSIWYHGQNWALNDCHKRSLADGFSWTLSIDLDEMLAFAAPRTSIAEYLKSLGRAVDVVDFGSVVTPLTRRCGSAQTYYCGALPPPKTSPLNVPGSVTCHDPELPPRMPSADLCIRAKGHRKHLTSTSSVLKLNIHWVDTCTPRRDCDTHHESTHVAWLRHMKPFESLIGGEACPDCVVAR